MIDGAEENGLIADWKLGYKLHQRQIFVFFVEVKRPNTSSKYQAESDYVKLLKEMKSSIDLQITLGVSTPLSIGLHVEGFRCELYTMSIKENGIYIPIFMKAFYLIENMEQAIHIPAVVESLLFVKENVDSIDEMSKKRRRKKPLTKFMKGSFFTEFKYIFYNYVLLK